MDGSVAACIGDSDDVRESGIIRKKKGKSDAMGRMGREKEGEGGDWE